VLSWWEHASAKGGDGFCILARWRTGSKIQSNRTNEYRVDVWFRDKTKDTR
jgi:hypothetical protein